MKKTPEQLLADKQAKLEKAKKALAALKKQVSANERKERDTAIYTLGACMLAAATNPEAEKDEEARHLRHYVLDVFALLAHYHAPEISDYRRKCLDKTVFANVKPVKLQLRKPEPKPEPQQQQEY